METDAGSRGGRVTLLCGFEPGHGRIGAPIAPPVLEAGRLGAAISCIFEILECLVEGRISGQRGGGDKEKVELLFKCRFPKGFTRRGSTGRCRLPTSLSDLCPTCAYRWPSAPRIGVACLGSTGLPGDCCLFPLAGTVFCSAEQAKGSRGPSFCACRYCASGKGILPVRFET